MITENVFLLRFLATYISTYISIIIPTIVYTNISMAIFNRFKLKKLSKTGYIINNQIPTPTKVDKMEVNEKIYDFILSYIEKLKDYTSEDNLQALYRNIKTAKISKQNPLTALYYSGLYNSKTNEIKYLTEKSVGHELLHLASSYYDQKAKTSYIGFKQAKDSVYIGQGLNEGYTELLASRIYNEKNKITAYHKEAKIAKLFEYFFDDPKEMENYYFNHDLPGFIHHMEKYTSRQNVINTLLDIDEINSYSQTLGSPLPTINSIKTQLTLYNWFDLIILLK